MVTSSTNCATSQDWVGGTEVGGALVAMASVEVGNPAVLVGGIVGGFKMADWVMLASTVWAAAVSTTSASAVGVAALEGRLHADTPIMKMSKMETSRIVVVISLPPCNSISVLCES
jgi:hypothetical protein